MALRSHYDPTAVLLAVALTLSHFVLANPDAPCYDPTGTVVPGYYPCDSNAYITNCCASGWTCFSNSLCVVTTASKSYPNLTMGAVERSMCTNPMWNNDICGDFCITGPGNTDGEMVACGDNHFCCLGDYNAGLCNCTTAADGTSTSNGDSFIVNDGRAQTIIDETATFTGTVSYLTSQPTPLPTSSRTASTSSSSGTANSTVTSGSRTATPTNTDTKTGTSTPSPEPKNKSNTLAIGLGVGLGVGAAALVGGGYFAYRAWQRRQGAFGRGSFGRHNIPTDLALDGTAFREQMAMNPSGYDRDISLQPGLDGHDGLRDVPLPPHARSAVSS